MMLPSGSRKKSVQCRQLGRSFGGLSGDFDKNLKLSQGRSEVVVQYLTVKRQIPLRPHHGADGLWRDEASGHFGDGNRSCEEPPREVRIMANKGLSQQ